METNKPKYKWGVFKVKGWQCVVLSNDKDYCDRLVKNRNDLEVREVIG